MPVRHGGLLRIIKYGVDVRRRIESRAAGERQRTAARHRSENAPRHRHATPRGPRIRALHSTQQRYRLHTLRHYSTFTPTRTHDNRCTACTGARHARRTSPPASLIPLVRGSCVADYVAAGCEKCGFSTGIAPQIHKRSSASRAGISQSGHGVVSRPPREPCLRSEHKVQNGAFSV